ncbi:MAG: hypothetical protein QOF91_1575, partial [Alphaproteobacteria bacterium]|nr:hypothetical protein [Alphaproteobacteria bacterium]
DASALDAEQEALLRLALGVWKDDRVNDRRVPPFSSVKDASGAWHV